MRPQPGEPARPLWLPTPATGAELSDPATTVPFVDNRRLLERLARGDVRNVRFVDLCRLVEALGFQPRRITGSHHIYAHPGVPDLINLQDVRGQAKPYQVRQLVRLVELYDLELEGER